MAVKEKETYQSLNEILYKLKILEISIRKM